MNPISAFIHSVYSESVRNSASGSACAAKVAFGWQYALHPSQPLPVSQASKKPSAVSAIVAVSVGVVDILSRPPGQEQRSLANAVSGASGAAIPREIRRHKPG